ncbi:ATP-dependent RNA helicase [Exidia glandulosa HHB12029]|uniref:ATP-dependent RNA helicase n=1 Tax=Exidia glandulosa HHB12029 TaxID=1314781 RepID=A0A165CP78_EXIGL|nr:ATP-dependent RNA helicase [Exidia glandulosa HHB12029]
MADDERSYSELAELVHNGNADKDVLLKELGLDGVPSRDEILRELEDRYLTPKDVLPDHWLSTYQIHWEHKTDITSLLKLEPSPPQVTLVPTRAGLDGRVVGWAEAATRPPPSARTSMSLNRAPAPPKNFVRGKAGYVPYMPGGLEDVLAEAEERKGQSATSIPGLRTVPPGFERGLRLGGDAEADDVMDLDGQPTSERVQPATETTYRPQAQAPLSAGTERQSEIDELLPTSRAYLTAATSTHKPTRRVNVQKRDWAHVIDVRRPMTRFHELVPNMAHSYPFELDTFQKEAVYHLEMGDSVFVAAHTSAGKTVVAEYAIALAMKHMTRAIYTSPIKALSNQKFRDFKTTFSSASVGILTGDVQINPEASCLIMTTEILRSMLYKGADLIRDVEFVIFDEVHYVNDAERGVVWEEVIIMLPDHVNIILLSATVPNTREFADWIGRTKKKDIYVISTPQRPVPLEHFLYAGKDMYKIVDSTGTFLGQGYKDAGEGLRRKQDKEREAAGLPPVQRVGARGAAAQRPTGRGTPRGGRGGPGRGGGPGRTIGVDKNLYVHMLGLLKKKHLLPVVVFTFSKRRCEENASTLTNLDLGSAAERSEVHIVIEKALARLKGSDKRLPQIARMRDLLSRGIGVHHGGLLPIVKEVVEILFSRGLVKVLFATETFAMGVNMPARCVVFSNTRKHDGRSFRDLNPGEYTQMSGRAGRRGLDSTGVVIIVVNDELPDTGNLTKMLLGTPTRLVSQFRLTYNMILNLLRVEALRVEEMIKRSFSENSTQRLLPDQQKKVLENEDRLRSLARLDCEICNPDINAYYDACFSITAKNQRLVELGMKSVLGDKYMTMGRVVVLRDGHFPGNVAVLLKRAPSTVTGGGVIDSVRVYHVIALATAEVKAGEEEVDPLAVPPRWPPNPKVLLAQDGQYDFSTVPVTNIWMVTNRVIKVDADSIVDRGKVSAVNDAVRQLREVSAEWTAAGDTIPEVDWSKIRALDFQDVLHSRNALAASLQNKSCLLCGDFDAHYQAFHGEKVLRAKIADLKLQISDQNLELLPEYESRIEVLKELNFIDNNSTVVLKGRVACEINTAHELILTELILENTLAAYEPEEVVALLSCFVFQEKTDVEPVIPEKLQGGLDAIRRIADRVGRVQLQHRVSEQDFENKIKSGLVEVVYEWAKGMVRATLDQAFDTEETP